MFIKEYTIVKRYERASKHGKVHEYWRSSTVCEFRCDNCGSEFERPRGSIDPKRLNNNYFHVCSDCNAKVFAQKKGVERKKVWSMNASSNIPIGRL